MSDRYILDKNGNPIKCEDLIEWAKWFEIGDRIIALDLFNKVRVSTVFLGLDHSFTYGENHIPILYETMIFGGENDQYQNRYATKEEALIGHQEAVDLVKKELE